MCFWHITAPCVVSLKNSRKIFQFPQLLQSKRDSSRPFVYCCHLHASSSHSTRPLFAFLASLNSYESEKVLRITKIDDDIVADVDVMKKHKKFIFKAHKISSRNKPVDSQYNRECRVSVRSAFCYSSESFQTFSSEFNANFAVEC